VRPSTDFVWTLSKRDAFFGKKGVRERAAFHIVRAMALLVLRLRPASRERVGQGRGALSNVLARLGLPALTVSSALRALVIVGAYFVVDAVLNKIALGDGWQIFWPLNGVTIALLISRPRREWALLLAAVALGTGVGEFFDDNPLVSTLVQRSLSVMEVTLSASLLPPFVDLESWLGMPRLYPRFAAAVLVGPAVSGVLAAFYFYFTQSTPLWDAFNSWALADAMGIAAVLPLALALLSVRLHEFYNLKRGLITVGTLLPAFAVMALIFASSRYPLVFVLYPLLMLVDWILGLLGSSIALCGACVLAVFLTEHGYGPFAHATDLGMSRDLAVQAYLGFHLIGFLPTSILFLKQRCMHRELRHSLAQAARLAAVDSLTGVANRRALDSTMEEQWLMASRNQTPLALLMIDADNFKEYNDRLGHQAGDDCLRALATALTKRVSRPADLVARFGGEEFAVLLPDTPLEGARHVAEMIRMAIQNLGIAHPGAPLAAGAGGDPKGQRYVTVSIGCSALVPVPGAKMHHLVELADQALYEAKRSGRDRVCAMDPDAHMWSPGAAARKLRARIDAYRHRLGLPTRSATDRGG
jgi:diguanylate cyclase (GGDEF)-like protein